MPVNVFRFRSIVSIFLPVALFAAMSAGAETKVSAYYTGDLLSNTDGGLKEGSAYLSDAGLTVDADLSGLFGDVDANLYATFLWNNSSTISNRYVGDAQGVSNIDAEQAVRIYEFWYQQQLNDDVTMRFGLYDLNSEFDAIESASLFLNSSHGIGAEYSQSGQGGPSIFPVTSLAARFDMAINESSILRYAILDGVPGDPNDPSKTKIDLGGGDGVLHALEYNFVVGNGARLGIGGWLYSADFDRIEATANNPRDDGNGGVYGFIDGPLYSNDSGLAVTGFFRYGVANDQINAFDSYIGAGAVATGLLSTRPNDRFGIALASARLGDPFERAVGGSVDKHETTIELTYSTRITNWLRLQPDIQFVINPGFDPALKNALVLGLRFELTMAHTFRTGRD
ncbi:MAG: carbohydrate porin [Woeseiaceae bacterium]|nr:carbohydrate porin [Woeseiaceae bacterium]